MMLKDIEYIHLLGVKRFWGLKSYTFIGCDKSLWMDKCQFIFNFAFKKTENIKILKISLHSKLLL